MPPRSFEPSANEAIFTRFRDLPEELRVMVWGFAANFPRIVHISKKRLRTDKDPDWWKQVWSDKPINDEDREFYDGVEICYDDVVRIDKELACRRLLTSDEKYTGTMTRAEAKQILTTSEREAKRSSRGRPKALYGFKSESHVPALLLVCHESFCVASKVYSLAFSSLGAFAETYFNFRQDTLYLDGASVSRKPSLYRGDIRRITSKLCELLPTEELAQVENLALLWHRVIAWDTWDGGHRLVAWLHSIERCFPNLKRFTIIEDHFSLDKAEFGLGGNKEAKDYQGMKLVESAVAWDGKEYTYRINGYRIDESIPRPTHPTQVFESWWNQEAATDWAVLYPHERPWQLPAPEVKSMITDCDERRLLAEAYNFEKKYNKGRWYVNPKNPEDFEDYPWDDIEEDLRNVGS